MSSRKRVLLVGLDPNLIDFSQPGYAPGMTVEKVFAGLKSSEDELTRLGYDVEMCFTDFGDTAATQVQSRLSQAAFDGVLIGAGVPVPPGNFLLFEKLVNVVHEHAPAAKFCFNTLPSDTAAAVQRWL